MIGLVVLTVGTVACVFPRADASRLFGLSESPPAACPADIGVAPSYSLQESDADLARDLEAARELGATRYRFDVDWSVVESVKGTLNWAPVDRIARAVTAAGLRPLGVLAYTPAWARVPGASDSHGAPADPADYAQFAGRAAAHFANVIDDWEVWNEPNNALFWSPTPDAAAYGALLKPAYQAIKAAQPSATVLAGALSPGAVGSAGDIDPVTFLETMYANGAGGSFDALSVHPYTYPALPTDPATQSWSTFQKLPRLRDLMVAQGDGAKLIWITEFGAPTGTAGSAVPLDVQAAYLTDGIKAARELGYIATVMIYAIRDSGTDPADVEQNFGLMNKAFEHKPAFAAVQRLTAPGAC